MYTNNNTMNPSSRGSAPVNPHESIEQKLQGFESNLRREREEARRQLDLAKERRRLVEEEVSMIERAVIDLQGKLKSLEDEYKKGTDDELVKLRANVQTLTKEVSAAIVLLIPWRTDKITSRSNH
jgi:ribosome recycling factor